MPPNSMERWCPLVQFNSSLGSPRKKETVLATSCLTTLQHHNEVSSSFVLKARMIHLHIRVYSTYYRENQAPISRVAVMRKLAHHRPYPIFLRPRTLTTKTERSWQGRTSGGHGTFASFSKAPGLVVIVLWARSWQLGFVGVWKRPHRQSLLRGHVRPFLRMVTKSDQSPSWSLGIVRDARFRNGAVCCRSRLLTGGVPTNQRRTPRRTWS